MLKPYLVVAQHEKFRRLFKVTKVILRIILLILEILKKLSDLN